MPDNMILIIVSTVLIEKISTIVIIMTSNWKYNETFYFELHFLL